MTTPENPSITEKTITGLEDPKTTDNACSNTSEKIRQMVQAQQELFNPSSNRYLNGGI